MQGTQPGSAPEDQALETTPCSAGFAGSRLALRLVTGHITRLRGSTLLSSASSLRSTVLGQEQLQFIRALPTFSLIHLFMPLQANDVPPSLTLTNPTEVEGVHF